MATKTLYRAADDDLVIDAASFAETREVAEAYLANPGFGGGRLWVAEVEIDMDRVLDLTDCDDAVAVLADAVDLPNPGAIGADEWAPRIADRIAAAGYDWLRVRESYPEDSITWIWVGGDEPEMTECE